VITARTLCFALLLLACVQAQAQERVTVSTELERMRSADHLFQPQVYRLRQYSGFHRQGGNPDRMHCLYEEDGWRVVADHKGPGVVSRIWTTHGTEWTDIRVEVDGQTIFTGKAALFFQQEKLPFRNPLSEVRQSHSGQVTAEGESSGRNEWAVSYVPIPFAQRFRYLQRNVVYANINIKEFPAGTKIESFLDVDWNRLGPDFEGTAAVWKSMDLYGPTLDKCQCIRKVVRVVPSAPDSEKVAEVAELQGPGIIRGIRVQSEKLAAYQDVALRIQWDGEKSPSVHSPLDYGFGSREQRTLAIGQSKDGWRALYLPMPFRKTAKLALISRAAEPARFPVEIFLEKPARLPADVLYLHSHQNQGLFRAGKDTLGPQKLPIKDFYYRVGYTALDWQGAGHVVAYMDLYQCQPELDEHVFIDDERDFPDNAWNGTGHEDLFDMAWGHKKLSKPMTSGGSQAFEEVNVKLFWNDPMPFRTAIRFNWEWCFRYGIEAPRDARFASVVYWYGKP
jgi:hypothetical protein